MACELMLYDGQTLAQRAKEVREAKEKVKKLLALRKIGVVIGRQGAITFTGIPDGDRRGMTDACIYQAVKATPAFRAALLRAEASAGRKLDERQIVAGVHSHDNGATWGSH